MNDHETTQPDDAHGPGCPARYGQGDCDEDRRARDLDRRRARILTGAPGLVSDGSFEGYFHPVVAGSLTGYLLTAKGLEALGFPLLAAQQRLDARARLDARVDHDAGYDAPAGAGHEVEADRG